MVIVDNIKKVTLYKRILIKAKNKLGYRKVYKE